MKHKIIYLSLLISAIAAGCQKQIPVAPDPQGTFTGQFTRIRLNSNGKLDTTYANLQLTVQAATGYSVSGDTSTIHAGSYGTYQFSPNLVGFLDKTYPTTGKPAKIHLSGTYQYSFDGINFIIVGTTDSLGLIYNLKKM
jgi:hypothetical protein